MTHIEAFAVFGVNVEARLEQRGGVADQADADAWLEEMRAEALRTFRRLALRAHPDQGGSAEAMNHLMRAKELVEDAQIAIEQPKPEPPPFVMSFTYTTNGGVTDFYYTTPDGWAQPWKPAKTTRGFYA